MFFDIKYTGFNLEEGHKSCSMNVKDVGVLVPRSSIVWFKTDEYLHIDDWMSRIIQYLIQLITHVTIQNYFLLSDAPTYFSPNSPSLGELLKKEYIYNKCCSVCMCQVKI